MKSKIHIGDVNRLIGLTRVATCACTLLALLGLSARSSAETVRLYFDPALPQIVFAAGDIKSALESQGHTVQTNHLSGFTNDNWGRQIVLAITNNTSVVSNLLAEGGSPFGSLGGQAYALRTTTNSHLNYWVIGGDTNGAMYGGLQVAENISFNGLNGSYNSQETPFLTYRGMKLNLPLDKRIPTYVGGWSSYSARDAIPDVWDMTYWKTLIDQQARSRYNLLSVWVHHPFPALVSVPDYPNASLPNIQRYDGSIINLNHTQRVAFWREVMTYAHDRGMKFYFFNWNVYVDYASTQYPALTRDQANTTTIDYHYKSMQALLATYPELDGFGISGGDGMSGTEQEKTQWTWNAMGKAVHDYLTNNPSRHFNLIHRSLGTSPSVLNTIYAPLRALTNATLDMSAKYAMAHMYSTPTPRWANGDIEGCYNLGLQTFLTLRNDDYFYINWGDPKFVRDFMTGIPRTDTTVIGMYVGIDGYNPSRARLHKNPALNGQLEVERRWYMEMLWGRLSYNTNTSDQVLNNLLGRRYAIAGATATNLFNAWTLASRSLPKVTELVMKNWQLDFHWYPEGCWSDPSRGTGFRTISDATGATGGFAGQDVANASSLCNIANSAAGTCAVGKKSSYQLADEMQTDANNALAFISTVSSGGNVDLDVAIKNVKQMAYLSRYYAHKIRGATYNKAGNTAAARNEMGKAYCSWISYSQLMDEMYYGDSFRNLQVLPNWKFADAAALKEYTDLGGVGYPSCDDLFTLTTSGTNGSITLNPSGGVYSTGTVVTVTASPNFGYAFGNWSGDLSGSLSPTTITMNTNKNVTANFVVSSGDVAPWLETFTLNDGTKSHGAPTSWMATRASGKFEVSGNRFMINGASGEGVLETAPINISAGSVKASLQVQAAGGIDNSDYVRFYKIVDGGAKVLIAQQIGNFTGTNTMLDTNIVGTNLKLRIEASVSASDEYYFMDNLRVDYEAALSTFTLTISATNGSIVLNPPGGIYTTGTVVTVTANPNAGFAFNDWSGDLTGSNNSTTITMNGNKSVTANFVAVPTFTMATSTSNGAIILNPPGGVYNAGTVVTVTANPNVGYAFGSWSGDLSGSVNPTNITMNMNKSVTANFVPVPTYTLTTSATNGSITLNSPGGIYNSGTVVTVTAIPNAGYSFGNWSGNLSGSVNPTNITMSGNRSVTANFNTLPPGNMNVLFVVGSATGPSDAAISNRLQQAGYIVEVINDSASTMASATGKGLVIVSSTVGSGSVNTKFRDVTVPVINWETFVQDDFGFTTDLATDRGNASGQTSLNVTNVNHPLAAGLTAGVRTVATASGDFSWGEPGGSPIIIARLNSGGIQPCLYAYDAGAATLTGTAPARRVHLFLQNNTFASLNADGLSLFDAAVTWAIGQAAVPPSWVQPPVLQAGQLRLEWVGGTLQTTTNVAGPWSDLPGAVSPYLQPTTNPAQFFRVRQ
jgi:hypothetical protein